jgi:competence protein ComEC
LPPLLFPLLALVAGILVSPYLDNRYVWLTLPLTLLVAIARPRTAFTTVFLFGSLIRTHYEVAPPHIVDDGLPARVEAVLEGAPQFRAPGYDLTARILRVNGVALSGSARLTYSPPDDGRQLAQIFEELELGSGDRIEVLVRLRRPSVYRNPDGFDYRRFLERRGIYWTGSIRSPRLIQVVSHGWHVMDRLRRWASERVEQRLGDDETVWALALGMVLGQRRRLPDSAESQFEAAGLIHLLVVSGFNLAIVAAAALYLGRRIRFGRRGRTSALIFALGIVLTYALLVEGEAPVTRATMMASFLIVGTLLDRGYAVGNALCAAGITILTLDPLALLDTGFQLTFTAVLAILFLAAPLIRWGLGERTAALHLLDNPAIDTQFSTELADWRVSKRLEAELWNSPLWVWALPRRLTYILFEAAVLTSSVQFTLLPWSVESYHRLSPIALPLNVVGAIVAGIVTPLGLVLILIPDFAAGLIATPIEVSLGLLVALVNQGLEFPGATFRVPSLPVLLWLAFTAQLLMTVWAVRRRSRRGFGTAVVGAIILLAFIGGGNFAPPPPEYPTLTFVDVGQGDAILVEMPTGQRFMIDGGGANTGAFRSLRGEGGFRVGADVLTPFLFARASGILMQSFCLTRITIIWTASSI